MAKHDEDRLAVAHLLAEVDDVARGIRDGARGERGGTHGLAVHGGDSVGRRGVNLTLARGRGGGGGQASGGAATLLLLLLLLGVTAEQGGPRG